MIMTPKASWSLSYEAEALCPHGQILMINKGRLFYGTVGWQAVVGYLVYILNNIFPRMQAQSLSKLSLEVIHILPTWVSLS